MSVLVQRFAFGVPILAAVVGLLLWDRTTGDFYGAGILAAVFALGAVDELGRMFRLAPRLHLGAMLLAGGILAARAASLARPGEAAPIGDAERLLVALAPGAVLILLLGVPPGAEALRQGAIALFGALAIALPLACILELGAATEWGIGWLIFLVLVVKANDCGAYLVGRKLGRTPLSPISPRKTREGAIAGLVSGVAAALALVALDGSSPVGYAEAAGVGLGLGVIGQIGDLVESYLKRCAGVKDSGALIPAFGGILDLLDSILLAGPVLLAVARLWEGSWSN